MALSLSVSLGTADWLNNDENDDSTAARVETTKQTWNASRLCCVTSNHSAAGLVNVSVHAPPFGYALSGDEQLPLFNYTPTVRARTVRRGSAARPCTDHGVRCVHIHPRFQRAAVAVATPLDRARVGAFRAV